MKKKIENYEKLVQKMKKISRLHMQECTINGGNNKFPAPKNMANNANPSVKTLVNFLLFIYLFSPKCN